MKIGDVFELDTKKGFAYLQFVEDNEKLGQLIRVLKGLYNERIEDLNRIVKTPELYVVHFPLKHFTKKKLLFNVGNYQIPKNFKAPKFMRFKHIVRGEILGWHIVNVKTWKMKLQKSLTKKQKQLSPWGIWNDVLLIERIEGEWDLKNWT